jgi:ribosomal protein S12 methylthiotransferase accessory factor
MYGPAAAWFDDFVSDRVGIVRSLARISQGATEPTPPVFYQAVLAHFDFRKMRIEDRLGVGKGLTDADAKAGAIGEALERYCGALPDMKAMRRFAWNERPLDAIPADACVLYSARQYERAQFPYPRWRNDKAVAWVQGVDLNDSKPVCVPASLVYLDYAGNDADTFFCPPTSNGLAAGGDLTAATLSALYELVERDSFLISWMNRLPPVEAVVSDTAAIETAFIRHYVRFGIETRVFRLVTDIPLHVMMAILLDRSGRGPAALVGLGCHPDPKLALRKAIFEAAQTRPSHVHRFGDPATWAGLRDYYDVRTLDDHSSFFASINRLAELDFLLDATDKVDVDSLPDLAADDPKDELARVAGALRDVGCRAVRADLTTPDLQSYPVRVVRIVATGLQPIHFGYGEERLGGRRLFEVPLRLGQRSEVTRETELNPCPHPLS